MTCKHLGRLGMMGYRALGWAVLITVTASNRVEMIY